MANPWINRTLITSVKASTSGASFPFTAATAGDLLVAVCAGDVTFTTPSGWTLPASGSAVNSGGLYVFYKTATGGEASLTSTQNGTGDAVNVVVYEFPAGTTFVKANAGSGTSTVAPTLAGLTGTNHLFAAIERDVRTLTASSASWTAPAGIVADVNLCTTSTNANNLLFSDAYLASSTASSFPPTVTQSNVSGAVTDTEWVAFAVTASSSTTGSGTLALSGSGALALSGTTGVAGSLALGGTGTLTLSGAAQVAGVLPRTGSGALALSGTTGVAGSLALGGTGTLTLSGTTGVAGSLTSSGAGALALTGSPAVADTLALSGSGVLALSGAAAVSAPLALSGTGVLALSGTAAAPLPLPDRPGTAALTGAPGTAKLTVPVAAAATLTAAPGTATLTGPVGTALLDVPTAATATPAAPPPATATLTGAAGTASIEPL